MVHIYLTLYIPILYLNLFAMEGIYVLYRRWKLVLEINAILGNVVKCEVNF